MEIDSASWYTYSDPGVWYYFDMCMSELMQDQIPRDYDEEVEDSERSGEIRYCHAMLDRHVNPDVTLANVCSLFYDKLFNHVLEFTPWVPQVPHDIRIRRVNEIHDYIKSIYGDERNKNINKFLIVVKFGVLTTNDYSFDEDDETEIKFVSASKSSIEGLETVSDLGDGEECAICLEEGKKEAKQMPCMHVFHGRCIEEWLGKSHLCPLCRYAMLCLFMINYKCLISH